MLTKNDTVSIILISALMGMIYSFGQLEKFAGFGDLFRDFGQHFFLWVIVSTIWCVIWKAGVKFFSARKSSTPEKR